MEGRSRSSRERLIAKFGLNAKTVVYAGSNSVSHNPLANLAVPAGICTVGNLEQQTQRPAQWTADV